nr:peptidoglycan DD-metalloendopeptidase family protein [Pantoea sp. Mhis]
MSIGSKLLQLYRLIIFLLVPFNFISCVFNENLHSKINKLNANNLNLLKNDTMIGILNKKKLNNITCCVSTSHNIINSNKRNILDNCNLVMYNNSITLGVTVKKNITCNNLFTLHNSMNIKLSAVVQQPLITNSNISINQFSKKNLPSKEKLHAITNISSFAMPFKSNHFINSKKIMTNWYWPTNGKIINNFSLTEGGNKGIDIAGLYGQPIVATALGKVVYAGNALRGYGNLIIIKHDNNYLSAYAHNDTILVWEQQKVKAGQKIATMGRTGTNSVRLHFEIRYKGKSVNPLRYLAQR